MAPEDHVAGPESGPAALGPVTVVGGRGFIGSHLTARLDRIGARYRVPARDADLRGEDLGLVVYCAGVTADFRSRPYDTVDAHVGHLVELLRGAEVRSLVYLSSTRVYRRASGPAGEDAVLSFDPRDPEDLYDLSKTLGEAVALGARAPAIVLRLSNVYGPGMVSPNFLAAVLDDALATGTVVLRSSLASAKDYVSVDDVVETILNVAGGGKHPVYNVASGANVAHGVLLDRIRELTRCEVSVAPDAPDVIQPVIVTDRLREEFAYRPASVLDALPELVRTHRLARSGRQ